MKIDLDHNSINLINEALAMAAARKESQARAIKHGRKHDVRAASMRRLRAYLIKASTPRLMPGIF